MLKHVKSNPYYFIKAIETNPSKYKESIEINILTDLRMIQFSGTDLPKDTFENGIPLFETSETPKDIFLDIVDKNEYDKSNRELSKDLQKSIEEVKEAHPNSLIDELGEIIEKQTSIYDYLGNVDEMDDEQLKEDLF